MRPPFPSLEQSPHERLTPIGSDTAIPAPTTHYQLRFVPTIFGRGKGRSTASPNSGIARPTAFEIPPIRIEHR
ncbi:hypothetical protein NJ7G_3425 [Natrinema sp. J7-2]|nr:hypothetical protein NJ7G_3425 [Natrinema sp. J7-2]